MATYRVDCVWSAEGSYLFEGEALTEEDAIQKANDAPLPDDAVYLDGSFEIICVEEVKPWPA